MHGPVQLTAGAPANRAEAAFTTRLLSQLNQAQPSAPGTHYSHILETLHRNSGPTPAQIEKQFELAAHPALKIDVDHEGWYSVGQPQLVQAG